MAYEGLNQYTDSLTQEFRRTGNDAYLVALFNYHEYVLRIPKFKAQRKFCERMIFECSPAFYKGAFQKEKP